MAKKFIMKITTILNSVKNARTIRTNLANIGLKFTSDSVFRNFVREWCKVKEDGVYYLETKILEL